MAVHRRMAVRRGHGDSSHGHGRVSGNRLFSTWSVSMCFLLGCSFMAANIWFGYTRIESFLEENRYDQRDYMAILPQFWMYQTSDAHATAPTVRTTQRKPTNHACDGYLGIYHIEKGDIGGAAGTIFFQFVIGQLIYAEKYNLKPWVFLNNVSYVIYDPIVHGRGTGVHFNMMSGMNVSYIQRENGHWRDAYPGAPEVLEGLVPTKFHFDGNGVWEDYFEPVSDFVPGDLSCQNKPLVTMDLYLVTPGVHGFAPWAPRCWRYQYLPDYVTKPHVPLEEWLEPQRHAAHKVLTKYIHFLPHIREKAEKVNPSCSLENSCLGLHIRQSDKAAGRRQLATDEFLPYAKAFFDAGGKWIYLATDSANVMKHIREEWPQYMQSKIRTLGDNVVRSNNEQAVFDIGSHHRVNTEILIEILALSKCQFMIHGLSAVTETSIWINVELHYTSINLEDPDHLTAPLFGDLVRDVLQGGNATKIQLERRTSGWWKESPMPEQKTLSVNGACEGFDGILHIANVGSKAAAGTAFFSSILNQLIYAERHNLKPWIHISNDSHMIYDESVHGDSPGVSISSIENRMAVSVAHNLENASMYCPGKPTNIQNQAFSTSFYRGDGVWNNYFLPVSDFFPEDTSCTSKPMISMSSEIVMPGLLSWCPWTVRAWRYDDVPDGLWNPSGLKLRDWLEPMRLEGHKIVKKYYQFQPHIWRRAAEVHPQHDNHSACLAVHIRNSDKRGRYRSKFPPNKFRDYMDAFVRAGGKAIYVATDSHRMLEYINKHFPPHIRDIIYTQGPYVVRSTQKWPIHFLENHHRTNSEVLVDILAMSKCQLLLHGNSAVSEAAIYLNIGLHNRSVNWEDKDRMSVQDFEELSKKILEGSIVEDTSNRSVQPKSSISMTNANQPSNRKNHIANMTILKGSNRRCRKNAIVYLAQKRHTSYDRNSYGMLLKSLELVNKNYLSLSDHQEKTDVIIFHTAEFGLEDLTAFEDRFGSDFGSLVQFVDLADTRYWRRPSWHERDNATNWYAYPLFSEGYRRMMHWFAIDIWKFFADYNAETGCGYEYIMRFDEDSFLHSPIQYDVFDFMRTNKYVYGFRLCSYEMQTTQRIWKMWRNSHKQFQPIRDIQLEMCGIYNNFFVASLDFFQGEEVESFLKYVDRQGMIYRRRLGDLMIHSMAVYAFAPPEKIHRFLDFTYEHATVDKHTGCVMWGGIQAGYDDPNADNTLSSFYREKIADKGCQANLTIMRPGGLSPTYSHIPQELKRKVELKTVMAGKVELPRKGILSG